MKTDFKRLGHLYFLFLTIGSIVFYKERTLYMDCAYHCFNLVNSNWFFVASNRYSVVIPELIPLIFIWLKAPLPVILIAFSLSYTLLYYVIFLLSAYWLKASYVILPIILILTGFSVQSYFHIVTETHQGLMYTVLLFAWLNFYNQHFDKKLVVFFLPTSFILALAFFAHPITLFPVIFILGFLFFAELHNHPADKKWIFFKYASILILALSAYLLKVILTPVNSYDGQFYLQLHENLRKPFFKLHPLFFAFYHYKIYTIPAIILIIICRWYWLKKEKILFFFILLSSFLFSVIVQLAFGKGDSDVMMEKNLMPLAVLIGIPLCYYLIRNKQPKQMNMAITLVLFSGLISCINEISYSSLLRKRIDFYAQISNFADKECLHKLLLSDSCAPNGYINWAICPEIMLYSALNNKNSTTAVYINDSRVQGLSDSNLFLFVPFMENCKDYPLNPYYFSLQNKKYVLISCRANPDKTTGYFRSASMAKQ